MQTTDQDLPSRLQARVRASPERVAYRYQTDESQWHDVSWHEVGKRIRALSAHLARLGVTRGDCVAIMLPTAPEWEYCQFAALAVGGVVVGLDAHDTDANLGHILALTRPKLLIVDTLAQLERISSAWQSPALALVRQTAGNHPIGQPLAEAFASSDTGMVFEPPDPDQLATIIFTSGSTGQPKGIGYTHKQISLACDTIRDAFPSVAQEARLVCWLPLSNLFQRMINLCGLTIGATTSFVSRPDRIIQSLPDIAPTFFIAVPRFFEKLHEGICERINKQPAPVRLLVKVAWATGNLAAQSVRTGHSPPLWTRLLRPIVDLALEPVRRVMGSRLEFMISGSAPLPPWLMARFHGLGWLVLEAYGISENVLPIALNRPVNFRFGSVGLPLPGNELRIANDKELLVRGPGVFSGYLGSEEGSTDALDADGWLHTGDYARLDDAGYLWLEGRKSEIFKTSTGRRIAPAPIEAALKQIDYVENAMIVGRERPYPAAILTIQTEQLDLTAGTAPTRIAADVSAACRALPDSQQPGAIIVSNRPFTIDSGELTANLKIRRKVVETRFVDDIDQAYATASTMHAHARNATPISVTISST